MSGDNTFDYYKTYTDNFLALQKKNKRLAELVDSSKIETFFFFDKKNQPADANDRLKDFDYQSQFLIVIGLAPYYHLKNITEKYVSPIFVFEPSPAILKQKMHEHDFREILSKENVKVSSSIKDLIIFLSQNFSGYEDGQIYCLGGYYILEPAILDLVGSVVLAQTQLSCVVNNTLRKKCDTWIPYFFENMKTYFKKYNSARTLDNIFKDENRTCVIVGASPSVDKAIEILQPIKDNVDWFACDVSTEIMKKVNIQPQAIFSLESNEFSYSRIDKNLSKKAVMFLGDIANPKTYKIKSLDRFIIYQDGSGMNNDFCKNNSLGQTPVGSTVLSVAFCTAIYMQYKNIIIIGSDFCFDDNNRYSKLTCFSDKEKYKKELLASKEYYEEKQFEKDYESTYNDVFIVDVYGKQKTSLPAYILSRKWIGITAINHKEINFYNLTEGLPLLGFTNIPLSNKIKIETTIKDFLSKIKPYEKSFFDKVNEKRQKPETKLSQACDTYKQDIYNKLILIHNISNIIRNRHVSPQIVKLYSKANDFLRYIIDEDSLLSIFLKKEIETMNAERYLGMKENDKNKKIERIDSYTKQFLHIAEKAESLIKQLESL